jgi:hypothetical protein
MIHSYAMGGPRLTRVGGGRMVLLKWGRGNIQSVFPAGSISDR